MPDFQSVVNLGVGGLALWMVYLLVKPLIAAQMDALKQMTAAVASIQAAQAETTRAISALSDRMERHMKEDEATDAKILRVLEDRAAG